MNGTYETYEGCPVSQGKATAYAARHTPVWLHGFNGGLPRDSNSLVEETIHSTLGMFMLKVMLGKPQRPQGYHLECCLKCHIAFLWAPPISRMGMQSLRAICRIKDNQSAESQHEGTQISVARHH